MYNQHTRISLASQSLVQTNTVTREPFEMRYQNYMYFQFLFLNYSTDAELIPNTHTNTFTSYFFTLDLCAIRVQICHQHFATYPFFSKILGS